MNVAATPSERSRKVRALMEGIAGAALEAGALLRALQSQPRDITEKGRKDLVTDADRAAEALLRERLSDEHPGARFLLEEGGEQRALGSGDGALRFIIDPVDGTTNYAANLPHFGVSIGVEQESEEPRGASLVAGCIYDPWRDELFVAGRGEGAWLRGQRLIVSEQTSVGDATLATGFAYDRFENRDDNHAEFCALNLRCRGVRRFGAATLDLAWVAAGRLDGFWERGLKPWDVAAGVLLVEEAGGRVTRYDGGPFALTDPDVVMTNGSLHGELLAALASARRAAGLPVSPRA